LQNDLVAGRIYQNPKNSTSTFDRDSATTSTSDRGESLATLRGSLHQYRCQVYIGTLLVPVPLGDPGPPVESKLSIMIDRTMSIEPEHDVINRDNHHSFQFLNRIKIPAFVLDENFIVRAWNQHVAKISRIPMDDALSCAIFDLVDNYPDETLNNLPNHVQLLWKEMYGKVIVKGSLKNDLCWCFHRQANANRGISDTQNDNNSETTMFRINIISYQVDDDDSIIKDWMICFVEKDECAPCSRTKNLNDLDNNISPGQLFANRSLLLDNCPCDVASPPPLIPDILSKNQKLYDTIIRNSYTYLNNFSMPSFLINCSGVILFWSEMMERLSGFTCGDMLNTTILSNEKNLFVWNHDRCLTSQDVLTATLHSLLEPHACEDSDDGEIHVFRLERKVDIVLQHKNLEKAMIQSWRIHTTNSNENGDDHVAAVFVASSINDWHSSSRQSDSTDNILPQTTNSFSKRAKHNVESNYEQWKKEKNAVLAISIGGIPATTSLHAKGSKHLLDCKRVNSLDDLKQCSSIVDNGNKESNSKVSNDAVLEMVPNPLRANELSHVLDTCSMLVFGVDRNGIVNEWNDQCSETLGFHCEDAVGKLVTDTFVSSNASKCYMDEVLQNAYEGVGTPSFELIAESITGEKRVLLLSASPRWMLARQQHTGVSYSGKDKVNGVLLFGFDTTVMLKHYRAVATMAADLRQLIDTANAPIFGIDSDG
jgi:PAS domain-containing protein